MLPSAAVAVAERQEAGEGEAGIQARTGGGALGLDSTRSSALCWPPAGIGEGASGRLGQARGVPGERPRAREAGEAQGHWAGPRGWSSGQNRRAKVREHSGTARERTSRCLEKSPLCSAHSRGHAGGRLWADEAAGPVRPLGQMEPFVRAVSKRARGLLRETAAFASGCLILP